MNLDDLFAQIQAGKVKELRLILKADVQGSLEAITQTLQKLTNDDVKVIDAAQGNGRDHRVRRGAGGGIERDHRRLQCTA